MPLAGRRGGEQSRTMIRLVTSCSIRCQTTQQGSKVWPLFNRFAFLEEFESYSTQWTPASYMTQGQWCMAHTKNTLTSHRKRPEWSREQPSRYRGYCAPESWVDPQPFDPPFFAFGVTYLLATYPCQVGVLLYVKGKACVLRMSSVLSEQDILSE